MLADADGLNEAEGERLLDSLALGLWLALGERLALGLTDGLSLALPPPAAV